MVGFIYQFNIHKKRSPNSLKASFFITSYNFKFRLSEFTVTKLNYSHIISSSVRNKH